jgi:coenzyme F420-0:L-glutamate ligase/coenzyme F420-1:gamma-L-glutamate ligase
MTQSCGTQCLIATGGLIPIRSWRTMIDLTFVPLTGIPLIEPGDDLGLLVAKAVRANELSIQDSDVLVVAQKIISKAEDRFVRLRDVSPSPHALELAELTGKDPRLVEVILWDTAQVIRAHQHVLIVAHHLGFICANAGIDHSNVGIEDDLVLRLPADPDQSARRLRARLSQLTGAAPAVIINDSHGRPWREGTVGVVIGLTGLTPVQDLRGHPDLFGYRLQHTTVGFADQIAAGASLVMGQTNEGIPAVLVRGLPYATVEDASAHQILRSPETDLFRQ